MTFFKLENIYPAGNGRTEYSTSFGLPAERQSVSENKFSEDNPSPRSSSTGTNPSRSSLQSPSHLNKSDHNNHILEVVKSNKVKMELLDEHTHAAELLNHSKSTRINDNLSHHRSNGISTDIIVLNPLLHYKKPDIGGATGPLHTRKANVTPLQIALPTGNLNLIKY